MCPDLCTFVHRNARPVDFWCFLWNFTHLGLLLLLTHHFEHIFSHPILIRFNDFVLLSCLSFSTLWKSKQSPLPEPSHSLHTHVSWSDTFIRSYLPGPQVSVQLTPKQGRSNDLCLVCLHNLYSVTILSLYSLCLNMDVVKVQITQLYDLRIKMSWTDTSLSAINFITMHNDRKSKPKIMQVKMNQHLFNKCSQELY